MDKKFPAFVNCIVAAAIALFLTACGGSSSGGSGTLSLNITDAPVLDEDIAEVWVRFTQVIIHPANGGPDIVVDVVNDDGISPWRDIELKSLVGGKTMLLGEVELAAGHYSWIRLVIDPDNTVIREKTGGTPDIIHPAKLLDCSSCDQSHLKLNRNFTIESGGLINFAIDFDLQQSLTLQLPQSVKPRPDYAYKLRPTLRIIDAELASTFIWGSVTDTRSAPVNPNDPTGCKIYTYPGDMLTVVLDDICIPVDAFDTSCDSVNNLRPHDIAPIESTIVGTVETFSYRTGALYPGIYTVAMICEPDDPDLDETLAFIGEQEVDATLDPPSPLGSGPVDFLLAD